MGVGVREPRSAVLVLVLLLAAACSDADGGTDGGDATGSDVPTAEPVVEPLAVAEVGTPDDGEARVALGASLDVTLPVQTCTRDLGAQSDGGEPSEQVVVRAEGRDRSGTPVVLDVHRYRSEGASPTITDTVRVVIGPDTDPERVLEAQRFEIDGLVTDPRDPTADDPLLRTTEAGVDARGVFAPPGAFADDGGLVEGVIVVSCAG